MNATSPLQTDQPPSDNPVRLLPHFRDISKRFARSPHAQAILYQDLIMHRALDPKISGQTLAALVRAWDVLEERKRILRGKPLPGQLRPDLDPVQLAKAAKRAKARLPHDIGSTIEAEEASQEGLEEPQADGGESTPQDSEEQGEQS